MNNANNEVTTAKNTPNANFSGGNGNVVVGDLTPSVRTASGLALDAHGFKFTVCFTSHQTTSAKRIARNTRV
jgi:hypothetical protein